MGRKGAGIVLALSGQFATGPIGVFQKEMESLALIWLLGGRKQMKRASAVGPPPPNMFRKRHRVHLHFIF